jgi:hypothetical protein
MKGGNEKLLDINAIIPASFQRLDNGRRRKG